MAVYDVSDLSGTRAGLGNVETHLENMLVDFAFQKDAGTITTTSTTDVSLYSYALTGVETTELVEMVCSFSVSGTTAGDLVEAYGIIGGQATHTYYYYEHTGTAFGKAGSITIPMIATGLSGSVTAEVLWKRASGSGTLYCSRRNMIIKRYRHGATA